MKKILLLLVVLLLCSISTVVSAHGYGPRHHGQVHNRHYSSQNRIKARRVLRYTADSLRAAQNAARRGHYREGLGRAFAHQKHARTLYHNGAYSRSIAHSLRAREIAEYIISVNRNPRRHRHPRRYAHHNDLDREVRFKVVDDNVALKLRINLD